MAYVETGHKLICNINTGGDTCLGTVALTIKNDIIYCVRTKSEKSNKKEATKKKQPVDLYIIRNAFSKEANTEINTEIVSIETTSTKNIAMHANSLTYHNNLFYLVTRNKGGNQVMAFGVDGKIKAKYTYAAETIGAIDYYRTVNGEIHFLISYIRENDPHAEVHEVKISGNKLVDVGNSFIALVPDTSYDSGNDSFYDRSTKQLYLIRGKKIDRADDSTKKTVLENLLMQYDLSGGISGTGKSYSSVRTLHVAAASGEKLYELEGICIYNGKKYVCVNSKSDSVDQLYKL